MALLLDKLRRNLVVLGSGQPLWLVAGCSGGADSTVLIDGLSRLLDEGKVAGVVVAHLNHRLRGEESDGDEEFVRGLAVGYGLELRVGRLEVGGLDRGRGQNLEATARHLRYEFLERVALEVGASAVVTAHTMDDQAETVVMRLLRGSGGAGLTGMRWQRPLGSPESAVSLLRPLLDVSREEILAYAAERGLSFRVDQSNFSIDYTRNRIRHELLPLLRSYNPRVTEALCRTARLIAEDDDYLVELASRARAEAGRDDCLSVARLRTIPPPVRLRLLRLWLGERRGDLRRLAASHFAAIDHLLDEERSGRQVELPGGGVVVREFDLLRFRSAARRSSSTLPVNLLSDSEAEFGDFNIRLRRQIEPEALPESMPEIINDADRDRLAGSLIVRLREDAALDSLSIRARRPGDALVPAGHRHRIKLKTLMIRHQIPRSRRDTWPVIVTSDDRIVWVPGIALAAEFDWRPDTASLARYGCLIAVKIGKLASEK